MVDKVIGTHGVYVVEGHNGAEFTLELKRLRKQLKAEGKKIESRVVTKAIFFTIDI